MRDSEIKNTVHQEGSISMTREKVTSAERVDAAKACVEGRTSAREAACRLEVGETRVHEWEDEEYDPDEV